MRGRPVWIRSRSLSSATLRWADCAVCMDIIAIVVRSKLIIRRQQFDFFDERAHFAFDVPCRARSNIMLANALLALSARHMHRTQPDSAMDEYLADRYNDACLQVLIPTLALDTAVENDDLLATLCLLRLLEEIDGR
jgi:hypothetical protein